MAGQRGALVPGFGPLEGVRVLDSARFVAGPWASTFLGEFGAEVIHVEGPPFHRPYADPTRSLTPLLPQGRPPDEQVSESWVQYSRNKLSLGLDLKTPDGVRVFLDLARRCDIWVESSRPGTYERLGLSDELVWRTNPKLTIVHVSGYGRTGVPERVGAPSFDIVGQAYSGYLSLQGDPDPAPPMRAGTVINDTTTGLAAATAGLMGYISAQRTGRGQAVDVAQYEVLFTMLETLALDFFARGVVRGRSGSAHPRLHPYNVYRAKDGWVVVAAVTPDTWTRLRDVVGIRDPRFDSAAYRLEHRAELDQTLSEFCRGRTRDELETIARERDVAIARVADIADIARDPHYRARGMFVEWDDPVAGHVTGAGIAPKFSRTPGSIWRGAPWLGQDNQAVLGSLLGYSSGKIEKLVRGGVVGEDRPRTRTVRIPARGQR